MAEEYLVETKGFERRKNVGLFSAFFPNSLYFLILNPCVSSSVVIPAVEDAVMKIVVNQGVLTMKNIRFRYAE